jgi:hypothetical protein
MILITMKNEPFPMPTRWNKGREQRDYSLFCIGRLISAPLTSGPLDGDELF